MFHPNLRQKKKKYRKSEKKYLTREKSCDIIGKLLSDRTTYGKTIRRLRKHCRVKRDGGTSFSKKVEKKT